MNPATVNGTTDTRLDHVTTTSSSTPPSSSRGISHRGPVPPVSIAVVFANEGSPASLIALAKSSSRNPSRLLGASLSVFLFYRQGYRLLDEHRRLGFHNVSNVRVVVMDPDATMATALRLFAKEAPPGLVVVLQPHVTAVESWLQKAVEALLYQREQAMVVGCAVSWGPRIAAGYHFDPATQRVHLMENRTPLWNPSDFTAPLPFCLATTSAHLTTMSIAAGTYVTSLDVSALWQADEYTDFGLTDHLDACGLGALAHRLDTMRAWWVSYALRVSSRLELEHVRFPNVRTLILEVAQLSSMHAKLVTPFRVPASHIVASTGRLGPTQVVEELQRALDRYHNVSHVAKRLELVSDAHFMTLVVWKSNSTVTVPNVPVEATWLGARGLMTHCDPVGSRLMSRQRGFEPVTWFVLPWANASVVEHMPPVSVIRRKRVSWQKCVSTITTVIPDVNLDVLLRPGAAEEDWSRSFAWLCSLGMAYLHGGIAADWRVSLTPEGIAALQPLRRRSGLVVGAAGNNFDGALFLGASARSPVLLQAMQWIAKTNQSTPLRWKDVLKNIDAHRAADVKFDMPSPLVSVWPPSNSERRGGIPRRLLILVSHTPTRSIETATDRWRAAVPLFDVVALNDTECARLASLRGAQAVALWKALEGAVTQRSEYCRVLAVHRYGGVYVDLDTEPRAPLDDVLSSSGDLLLVAESQQPVEVGTWLMGAVAGHPCLAAVLVSYELEGANGPIGGPIAFSRLLGTHLADANVTVLDHASPRMPARRLVALNESKQWTSTSVWRQRILYLPVARDEWTTIARSSFRAFDEQEVVQVHALDDDCLKAIARAALVNITTDATGVLWHELPWSFRTALCGAAEASLKDGRTLVVDARAVLTKQLAVVLEGTATTSLLLFEDGDEMLEWVFGVSDVCGRAAAATLWQRAVEATRDYANSGSRLPLSVWLHKDRARLTALGATGGGLRAVLLGVPECAATVTRFDRGTAETHFQRHGTWGSVPPRRFVITPYHPVSREVGSFLAQFAATNSDMLTTVVSVDDCLREMAMSKLGDEGGARALSLAAFELQNVACSLYYLMRDGGVVSVSRRALSHTPIAVGFNVSDDAAWVAGDNKASNDRCATVLLGAQQGLHCFSHVFFKLLSVLKTSPHNVSVSSIVSNLTRSCNMQPPSSAVPTSRLLPTWQRTFRRTLTNGVFIERIPRRVFLVWKSTKLFESAEALDRYWRLQEPTIERRVVTDEECRELAGRFPNLLSVYDSFPLNVMRADTCRVLAVYYYGGIYMDLDVAWVRRMDEWFDWGADLVVGNETEGNTVHLCNWFFAARTRHHCLRDVLVSIVQAGPFVYRGEHFVHDVTGPAMFTRGLRRCGVLPQDVHYSAADVTSDLLLHQYASQRWAHRTEYSSWIRERDRLLGDV